jgi:hypothetical protein
LGEDGHKIIATPVEVIVFRNAEGWLTRVILKLTGGNVGNYTPDTMQLVTPLAAGSQMLLQEVPLGLREQTSDKIQTLLIGEMLLHHYLLE